MLKKLILALVVFIAGLFAYASTLPTDYHIERSLVIKAPVAMLHAQVNDLHAWDAWSPWAKLDPNATVTFDGAKAGKGAAMHWEGNNDVGAGSMTIASSSARNIALALVFERPMKGEATSGFSFTPGNGGTTVTWSMSGKRDFAGKLISVFIDCDAMIGGEYEKGLANLKAAVKG